MPRPRKHLVCVQDTPYYHITSRCVRRAFLCGRDDVTGKSYEHRRQWIEDRIRLLSSLFSIEICAYAVMSNHYHLVVRIDDQEPRQWSDDEVLERWTVLFKGPLLVQRYRDGVALSAIERESLHAIIAVLRARLGSLSWFMRCLNEPIARQANREDRCSGHFWEARFHSQALYSETALLTAMVYVDLNPIRAGIATAPETSDYTSIKARLQCDVDGKDLSNSVSRVINEAGLERRPIVLRPLMPFAGQQGTGETAASLATAALPMQALEYLRLVDSSARLAVPGKTGRIDAGAQSILERLGMVTKEWVDALHHFRKRYRSAGPVTRSA